MQLSEYSVIAHTSPKCLFDVVYTLVQHLTDVLVTFMIQNVCELTNFCSRILKKDASNEMVFRFFVP